MFVEKKISPREIREKFLSTVFGREKSEEI